MDKKHISETNSVAAAIDKALQIAREDEIIIITGSLYTVGEAKAYFLEKGK